MNLRPFRFWLLASMFLALHAAPLYAWGPEGHRITGKVAEEYLSDQARTAIDTLLGGRTLTDVSVWADDVRQREEYQWTAPLHYVNAPRDASRINMRRDCENGLCVVGAIQHFTEVLKNEDGQRTEKERREALKFIVHFIGDVHQPMHVSYSDDRGGNRLRVSFINYRDTNLHRVWDTDMIRYRMNGGWPDLAREVQAMITDDHLSRWRQSLDPVVWANESLAITRRIYAELPRSDELGQDYYEHYIGDVLKRLAMAGVRIANLLNDVFPEEHARATDAADDDDDEAKEAGEGGDDDDAPQPTGIAQYLRIVEGDSCGRADGRFIYLENIHDSKPIRARIRRTWSTPNGERSAEESVIARPGESGRRRLGCSEQLIGRGEVRQFRWDIVEAEFR